MLRLPLNSYEGNYVDPSLTGRVVLRYLDNPNGAQGGAAAVANEAGNVVGVMPHPERASEATLGSEDGMILLRSFLEHRPARDRPDRRPSRRAPHPVRADEPGIMSDDDEDGRR